MIGYFVHYMQETGPLKGVLMNLTNIFDFY